MSTVGAYHRSAARGTFFHLFLLPHGPRAGNAMSEYPSRLRSSARGESRRAVKVRLTPRAERRALAIAAWWRDNRDASDLFEQELEQAKRRLEDQPSIVSNV